MVHLSASREVLVTLSIKFSNSVFKGVAAEHAS